jgi:hypothetical protein
MNKIRSSGNDIGVGLIETDNWLWDGLDLYCRYFRRRYLNHSLVQAIDDSKRYDW